MDGVLVDSSVVVARTIRRWAARHGMDPAAIIRVAQGRRTRDTVKAVAPSLDLEAEVAWLDTVELEDLDGIVAVPGAAALLAALPSSKWALVTSAGTELAHRRLAAAGLPQPEFMISGEIVERGKPAPDGYLLGALRIGALAEECLVFEDAPPGIAAGKAAGMRVIGLTTTHQESELGRPDAVIADLTAVRVVETGPIMVLDVT